jgi:hypothetical protein
MTSRLANTISRIFRSMKVRTTLLNVFVAGTLVGGCTQTDSRADAPRLPAPDTAASAGATLTTSPAQRAKANYVGLRYEGLPRGFSYVAGSVITPTPAGARDDYAFSQVRTPKGEMIWLDSLGAATRGGDRARIVRAALVVPPLAKDERLFMASCDANGKLDPMVVAIAVNEPDSARYTRIRQAWRADPVAARFELVPVAGIICEDPGT